jgi:CheY-like chemotaxis protein
MRALRGPVLVVDDDAEIREFFAALLELEGIATLFASSAREAEERLANYSPLLVLLDIGMPDRDGIDFCRAIKADPRTRDIPVFVVSAKPGREVIDRALAAGAEEFIKKPFANDDLIARIGQRIGRAA